MLVTLLVALSVQAGTFDLQLLPQRVSLSGPTAAQQLLLVASPGGGASRADLTSSAVYWSSDDGVASVDSRGLVRGVADGQAEIVARLPDGRQVSTSVCVTGGSTPAAWSFRNDVRAVLTKAGCNAGRCHGAAAGQNHFKLSLRGFDFDADYRALVRQELGRRVSTVEPADSLILAKPTLRLAHGGGKRIAADSLAYRILMEWIAAGAPRPAEEDPRIARIQVYPARATLRPGDRHQILARGFFDVGGTSDLTSWALYTSSDPNVAIVSETGLVEVVGPGEATISVWCLDRIASTRITVPFQAEIPVSVYEQAPRNNFVDELVLEKLRVMRIRPSATCTDAEFLRRAFLDAAGILPTADEAREFAADRSSAKRQRLVEALLERPEFVDRWAYKWSDLMLVSSSRLRSIGADAFHRWIRRRVAANQPWDEFVRDIVTAAGSTFENGAANYYLLHQDPTAVAENITLTFLGLSIGCARCHNHPLDKWSQDDYYALSNFFARVGRKDDLKVGYADNDRATAETTVFLLNRGDLIHPRRGRALAPRPLESEEISLPPDVDRREVFASWLTSPANRYFVRSVVNRVWHHFLGRGLVEPVHDMRETNPASNEVLLQALTDDFANNGFDTRRLIGTIMNSATYQASAQPRDNGHDRRCYSHFLVRRLPAEVLVDIIDQATGVPENFPGFPRGTRALELPDSRIASETLTILGRPARDLNSHEERIHDSTVTQVLHLVNGEFISKKLKSSEGRLQRLIDAGHSDDELIREIYWVSLSRPPAPHELQPLLAVMKRVLGTGDDPRQIQQRRREAFEDLWAGLLMSKEFLCNH